MYHAIVAARARAVWRRIDARDTSAAWAMAVPDLDFEFAGDTAISGRITGRDQFRAWLDALFDRFGDLRFTVKDVAVAGWPWRTRVAVRLRISATLADGSPYENFACQWITLRWFKMTDDWVLEDTARLQRALDTQARLAPAGRPVTPAA